MKLHLMVRNNIATQFESLFLIKLNVKNLNIIQVLEDSENLVAAFRQADLLLMLLQTLIIKNNSNCKILSSAISLTLFFSPLHPCGRLRAVPLKSFY